jgi:hypothetical protein
MHQQDHPFTITLADGVSLQALAIRKRETITAYQLSIDGKYQGEVYPDPEDAFTEWKSHDKMDPQIVLMIGRAIESHDA